MLERMTSQKSPIESALAAEQHNATIELREVAQMPQFRDVKPVVQQDNRQAAQPAARPEVKPPEVKPPVLPRVQPAEKPPGQLPPLNARQQQLLLALPAFPPANRAAILNSLKVTPNLNDYLTLGALGGLLGSRVIPSSMDLLTRGNPSLSRVGIGGGLGAGAGYLVGHYLDPDHEGRDTAFGGFVGAGLGALNYGQGRTMRVGNLDVPITPASYWERNHSPRAMEIESLQNQLALQREQVRGFKWLADTEAVLNSEKNVVGRIRTEWQNGRTGIRANQDALALNSSGFRANFSPSETALTSELGHHNKTPVFGDLHPPSQERLSIASSSDHAKPGSARLAEAERELARIERELTNLSKGVGSRFHPFGKVTGELRDGVHQPMPWERRMGNSPGAFKTVGEWRGSFRNAIGEGMLVALGGLVLNTGIDALANGNSSNLDQAKRNHKLYLDGLAVPLALTVPNLSLSSRLGIAATAILVEHGIPGVLDGLDKRLPQSLGGYSQVMQPNWIDAVGMSAAWMLPFRSEWARVGAVAAAWSLGRVANYVSNNELLNIPGIENPRKNEQAFDALKAAAADAAGRLEHQTFRNVVDRGIALGKNNKAALELTYLDYVTAHKKDAIPMDLFHTGAGLLTALGISSLETGTQLKNGDDPILAGKNLDLGGSAATYLFAAEANLVMAQDYARKNNIQAPDLQKSKDFIQQRIKLIYGAHDIPGAIAELRKAYRIDLGNGNAGVNKMLIALQQQANGIDENGEGRRALKAKLYRDTVLIGLAVAEEKAAHNAIKDAEILLETCTVTFAKAGKLADSDDTKALSDEIKRVKQVIQRAR